MRRLLLALAAALLLLPAGGAAALAHPLGNFTINHYAGIRVEPNRILLDVVIDAAEIPTFQATAGLDGDGDGTLSPAETAGLSTTGCEAIGRDLALSVDGVTAALRLTGAGVTLPAGNGGLPTMRSACVFEAPFSPAAGSTAAISFRDGYEAARIGWREITAIGDRMTIDAPGVPSSSISDRLRAYPAGLGAAPDVRAVSLAVRPGGAALAPFQSPEAAAIVPPATASTDGATAAQPDPVAAGQERAVVPGGADAIPAVLGQAPVSPLVALAALLVAAALGAGHALTPGHGKTLMAAYLVGTRGTPRHALGLGLAVSVSHTAGILVLALVILAAASRLPADVVVRVAPVIAAASVVAIGGWMLIAEVRRRSAATRHRHDHDSQHGHGHAHDPASGEHRHGPMTHTHVPMAGATVTWRGLLVLGLAGGLVPSASALLVLLGSIAAGRPAWGVVLVAAFGLGMAAVMAAIGLACVYARDLLDRAAGPTRLARVGRLVPIGTAILVLALGVVLTSQAIAGVRMG